MINKAQILVIISKVKEQGNYSFLVNYIRDNYQEMDSEVLELVTDTILENNNLLSIMYLIKKVPTINIEKVVNKVLTLDNNSLSIAEIIEDFHYNRNGRDYKNHVDLAMKCRNFVFENADIRSYDGAEAIRKVDAHFKYFLDDLIKKENSLENKREYNEKLQEHKALSVEKEKLFEQAKIEAKMDLKNKRIQKFKDDAKNIKYMNDYTNPNAKCGEFNDLLTFIRSSEELFTAEDEKAIIEIAHSIIMLSYKFIQPHNMDVYDINCWNISYEEREKLYIENNIKAFLSYYPDSDMHFIDIILKCLPKTIKEFAYIESFPFDEAYEIIKKDDKLYIDRGKTLVDYVVNTQEKHQYNITELENYVLDYYFPNESDITGTPIYNLFHKVIGVNKEQIEKFLFNHNVDYDQKPNDFFDKENRDDYSKEKARAKFKEYANKHDLRTLALKDLTRYDTVKYSRSQVEDEYIKRGIIDNNYDDFINYKEKGEGYGKWETFFCEKGTSSQIFKFVHDLCYRRAKEKIDFQKCLMACINKKDEDLASSIYSIMCEHDDVNLIVLEKMLKETGNEEVIKHFVNNQNLQNKYFEQLLEAETPDVSEQSTQEKQLIFKAKH